MLTHSATTAAPRQCDENVAEHRHPAQPKIRSPSSSSRTARSRSSRSSTAIGTAKDRRTTCSSQTHPLQAASGSNTAVAAKGLPQIQKCHQEATNHHGWAPPPGGRRRTPGRVPPPPRRSALPPHTRTSAASTMAEPRRHHHGRTAPPPLSYAGASRTETPSRASCARSGRAPPRRCAPRRGPPHRRNPPTPPADDAPSREGGDRKSVV